MTEQRITYSKALKLIQARRPQCNPNPGFQVRYLRVFNLLGQVQLYKLEDKLLHPDRKLPKPGELIVYNNPDAVTHTHTNDFVRVLSWNIERGYALLMIQTNRIDTHTECPK